MDIKKDAKEFLVFLLVVAGIFFLLHIRYFAKQIAFYFEVFRSPTAEQAIKYDRAPAQYEPNTLAVESLNIVAPIQFVESTEESIFQEALQNGVVHYPGTAMPGEPGNVYIFGHSSDNAWAKGDYKTILALLPKIEIGAEIFITNHYGKVLKYIVTQSLAVNASDTQYLNQDTSRKILTLQTSYPVGTSLRRWIVIAELIDN